MDSDCAGGDNEEAHITWTEDDEQHYVACVEEYDRPAMASCRAKPRWRRDYDPDALFRAKVPGGAFMPESTFVEDVEGAVNGTTSTTRSATSTPSARGFTMRGAAAALRRRRLAGREVGEGVPADRGDGASHAGDQGYQCTSSARTTTASCRGGSNSSRTARTARR